MNIIKKIKDRIHHRMSEHYYHNGKPINYVRSGYGVFNDRCFHNAVDYAHRVKGSEVVLGVIFDNDNYPIVHFWNRLNGIDIETTLGYRAKAFKYYELRIVRENDWDIIQKVFEDCLDYHYDTFVKWYERPFVERVG